MTATVLGAPRDEFPLIMIPPLLFLLHGLRDIHFKEAELNQGFALGSQPVVQKSDAKLAIEQLILQETFSRGESIRLTKIIQSRVVDCPTTKESVDAAQQELHDSTGRNSIASPGDRCSLSQTRRSPGAFPCSANSLRVLTPDAFLSQAHLPVLSHVSIEAKKWFEEKLESRSNLDWDHGPCTLNTAMLPNVTEDEVCSPIDMDKFYTEARGPWASPSSSSTGFKTPIRMYPYNDETSCANARCNFASSEVPENAWKMKCDSDSSEYSIPDSTSIPHNEFEFGVEGHATRSQCAFSSSSLGLKSPGFVDRISWKSTGFSHCEFAAARPTEACQLLTETSIDFPTTPKINGGNCADGPELDATSDLSWLLRAEPPLNSSHGLARNSMKTFSKKGKKLVSYRRSREQGK
ncbi:hypothetical protein MRB53_023721 [Persea americana]|uniref:Uncharacterized protein n=1 Tax=Persea americana TaxID=3435 RepID=A0ACC2LAS0_PERAE|nr:hypothetical protein MRB53_023721 [Persea americana]